MNAEDEDDEDDMEDEEFIYDDDYPSEFYQAYNIAS